MKYESLLVTKRNGNTEKIDLDKIHRVLAWAAEGLENVSVSLVEMRSNIQFYDNIKTSDIHETLVKATADLISPETPDYQYMAGRLAMFATRKQAYGEYTPPTLLDHITKLTKLGKYDKAILANYSKEEIEQLDNYIDHNRDMNLAYAGTQQMIGKYLLQDRVTKQLYESPQMLFMLVAMTGFMKYPKETRLQYVKRMYDALSQFKISLPTPIMGGLRTPTKQSSSCFVGTQLVKTINGDKQIQDIEIGDLVLTVSGEYKPVLAIASKPPRYDHVIHIKSFSGFKGDFISTPEHLVYAIKRGETEPKWIEARRLVPYDYVAIPTNSEILPFRHVKMEEYITNTKYKVDDEGYIRKKTTDIKKRYGEYINRISKIKNEIYLSDDFFTVLGMYIGNGYIDKDPASNCIGWVMNSQRKDDIQFIINSMKTVFNLEATTSVNPTDNSTKVYCHSHVVANLFRKLVGTGFANKTLDISLKRMEHSAQRALLKGIIFTDGFISNVVCGIAMSNKQLMKDIGDILVRLKISYHAICVEPSQRNNERVYYRQNGTPFKIETRKISYRFNINIKSNIMALNDIFGESDRYTKIRDNLKVEKLSGRPSFIEHNGIMFNKIGSIELHNLKSDEQVWDIQVQDNPSFVAGNIGVHNCVLVESGDSLDSINATANAIVNYISQRAGIGINAGAIRALNSPIRNGEAIHTGVIPFYKHFQTAVKSCSQGK